MTEARRQRIAENLYSLVANEEDARVCKDISDEACREVPGNFLRITVANVLTKTGDALINPKTVLAWLVQFVGAPAWILAMLVPVRESGSMLPQLAIAAWVRRQPLRKPVWLLGAALQAAAVVGIAFAAWTLTGVVAGLAILGAVVVFSLARGLCSVSSKDVLGKCIPKTRRGRVSGFASGISGLVVAGIGLALLFGRPESGGAGFYFGLLLVAAGAWVLALLVYSGIQEEPGETSGGGNAASEALKSLRLLKADAPFRKFVIARALMMSSALVAPYYVVLARESSDGAASMLGVLILAGGIAGSISAPFWGRLADLSSRKVLILSALIAGVLGVLVFALRSVWGDAVPSWVYPGAFLVLGVAHSGVRLGRKTYLVDMAGGNKRTDYVAVSNTVIGALLLVAGSAVAALSFVGPDGLILGLSLVAFAGAGMGGALPETE